VVTNEKIGKFIISIYIEFNDKSGLADTITSNNRLVMYKCRAIIINLTIISMYLLSNVLFKKATSLSLKIKVITKYKQTIELNTTKPNEILLLTSTYSTTNITNKHDKYKNIYLDVE
jgi:hypothetical protein